MNRPARAPKPPSRIWVYRGGPPGTQAIWFQYAPSRSGAVPIEFLFPESGSPSDNRFYLQTDGGYQALTEKDGIRHHVGCWAHMRRKMFEAANSRTKTEPA